MYLQCIQFDSIGAQEMTKQKCEKSDEKKRTKKTLQDYTQITCLSSDHDENTSKVSKRLE